MSHRASETTEANHLAPQVNWFQQQEDIKHLLFAFFVMGSKCVSQSLSLSFSRHTLLWVHTEDNQGAEKLKLLWSCNLLVKLRLIWNAANSVVGNICLFAVYSRGLFSKRRVRGLCQKLFLLCKRTMKGRTMKLIFIHRCFLIISSLSCKKIPILILPNGLQCTDIHMRRSVVFELGRLWQSVYEPGRT